MRVRRLRQLIRDRSGASAVEYGLILVFGVGLAAAVIYFFGHALNARGRGVAVDVENPPGAVHHDGGLTEGRGADAGFIRRGLGSAPSE